MSGIPAGMEDGMIQPAIARIMIAILFLYGTPSEISNSMRGVDLENTGDTVTGREEKHLRMAKEWKIRHWFDEVRRTRKVVK